MQIDEEGNLLQAGLVAQMVQQKAIQCQWAEMSFDDVFLDREPLFPT